MAEMKALMAEQKAKKKEQAAAAADQNTKPPAVVEKSPQLIYAHNDFSMNKQQVIGKQGGPLGSQRQNIQARDSESDDEPSNKFARQQSPAA